MSAGANSGKAANRARPLRRIRKAARRWGRAIGTHVGLLPPLANRGYMICATPRSGSNHLCQLLASTRLLGNPLEYFNATGRRMHTDPNYPKNPRAQLEAIRSLGATRNGIYAVKVLPSQFEPLEGRIDPFSELPDLSFVRLGRRDLLGQAISLDRARQTRQYIASDPQAAVATYSEKRIRACLAELHWQERILDRIMARIGVRPLTLAYEDVVRDPQFAVDAIASLMGVALPARIERGRVTHTIQRDQSSAAWRQRFLADTGDDFRHLAQLTTE